VAVVDRIGWSHLGRQGWKDVARVRALVDAAADLESPVSQYEGPPLHVAVERGSPEVVAEIAERVSDVDALYEGRTALWRAVFADRRKVVRVLVAAGADPWRPMMAGWSPARLSMAGGRSDSFAPLLSATGLSGAELTVVADHRRLLAAVAGVETEGVGLACVAGIDAAEAMRRLAAVPLADFDPDDFMDDYYSPHHDDDDEDAVMSIMGVTDVPGGCILTQPWGYGPSMPRVSQLLSKGTVCYGFYGNPKSGNQGSACRDAVMAGWDLHPGGGEVAADASADEVLVEYLFQDQPVGYACAYAGLRPIDARAVTGPPDGWFRLPPGDYWS
jgi:hypothetical protein